MNAALALVFALELGILLVSVVLIVRSVVVRASRQHSR
jgi:hypothetical protein